MTWNVEFSLFTSCRQMGMCRGRDPLILNLTQNSLSAAWHFTNHSQRKNLLVPTMMLATPILVLMLWGREISLTPAENQFLSCSAHSLVTIPTMVPCLVNNTLIMRYTSLTPEYHFIEWQRMYNQYYQRLPPTRGALFGWTFDAFCFGTAFVCKQEK